MEHWNSETGELLIRHRGSIHDRSGKAQAEHILQRDLDSIRILTDQHSVRLVLLTYSAFRLPGREGRYESIEAMSEVMRDVSRVNEGVALVDPHDLFMELFADESLPRSAYFLNDLNHHPNPKGYAEIAKLVADSFEPSHGGRRRGPT